MEKEIFISDDKQYVFPDVIEVIHHKGKILVVAPECVNWIVLENEQQLALFNLLRIHTLLEALHISNITQEDAENVLIQLEARKFELNESKVHKRLKAQLFLTNACNLSCPHCYLSAGLAHDNELSTFEIVNLLNNLSNKGVKDLVLTGGEISLRKDLIDIVKCASDLKMNTTLLTNGVLWGKNKIFETSKYIKQIQISIDGFSEEENCKVRGRGNFARALDTVDEFVKSGVATQIAITPMYEDNFREKIEKYVDFAHKLLNKYEGYNIEVNFTGEMLDGRSIKLTDKQKQEYSETIDLIYKRCYGIDTPDKMFIDSMRSHTRNDNCAFGSINVAPNGDVYYCARTPFIKSFANVRKNDFEFIWHKSEQARELSNIDHLYPCNSCAIRYICGGDCRIKFFDGMQNGLIEKGVKHIRECDNTIKSNYYDLMIKVNEDLYE